MRRKKTRRERQEHTVLWVLLLILVVCFAIIGFLFYKFFYAGAGNNKYGDRLEGIENYPLSETLEEDIKGVHSEDDGVSKLKVNVEGRIIYINIEFSIPWGNANAASRAEKALSVIGNENLTFYEVQFLLTYNGDEENIFPKFGMKNANNLKVAW